MDWRALALQAPTFGLSKLAEITDISKASILKWQQIGAWKVPPIRRGKVRTYNVWDAIRATIMRELSDAGMPISGGGEELTSALVGALIYAARVGPGDLSPIAKQVKLYRDRDGEWCIDIKGSFALDDECLGHLVTVLRLREIASTVAERSRLRI
jgi:hypothetical protein